MITTKGLGFLAVAAGLFLLAGLTQVGWLYLVDAVLWGIIVLSAVCPWLSLAFLSVDRQVQFSKLTPASPSPQEGDPLQITLTLRNRAFWPSYVLCLHYDCSLAAPERRSQRFFVTQVTSSGQVSLESTVEAYLRGMYQLGPVFVESSAPFGLFRRRVPLTSPHPVLVYPKVYPLTRLALADGLSGSALQSRKSRTGTDPAGSRRYVHGDPRRLIHWRNTARTAQLMVKELEDPADRTLYLVFDATTTRGEGRETTLEYGIKIIASVLNYVHRNQVPVELVGGGIRSREQVRLGLENRYPSGGWPQLLTELAMVKPGDGPALDQSLTKLPFGATALVVVSCADVTAMEALTRASANLHTLVVVCLEGFGDREVEDAGFHPLHATRTQIVHCRPGHLEEALRSLTTFKGPSLSNITAQKFGESGGQGPDSITTDGYGRQNVSQNVFRTYSTSSQRPSQ